MQRQVIQEIIIPAGHGAAVEVKKGEVLRIYLVEDRQVGDCVFFNAHDYREVFHVGQTWAMNVILGTGTAKHFTPSRPAKTSCSPSSKIRLEITGATAADGALPGYTSCGTRPPTTGVAKKISPKLCNPTGSPATT